MLNDNENAPAVVKQEEASQSSSGGEIGKWKAIHPASFLEDSAQFNSTSGRFKAGEEGLYLISAIVLIRHSASCKISMTIVAKGQPSNVTTFQPKPSNSPGGDFISTLTIVTTVRLVPNQYVSIFIDVQCQPGLPWKVLSNSSFSAVMVSRWESLYTSGFVATKTRTESGNEGFNNVYYWEAASFSKNLKVDDPINIKSSGLYFLQSVLILNDKLGNKAFDSGVCIDGSIAFNGITASKVSEGHIGDFVIGAFGVLYLRKGQNVYLCVRSENQNRNFDTNKGSWFSMVRFLPLDQAPGFHQFLQDGNNITMPLEWSVIRSMSTGGGQLAYIKSNMFNPNPSSPSDRENFTAPLNGTYLISLSLTLTGNDPANVTACVGIRQCTECYVEVSDTLRHHNNTYGFVGLLDLKKGEVISMCLKSKDETFSLVTATCSVQFLSKVEANRTVQLKHRPGWLSSSGWHELTEWETRSTKSSQKVYVMYSGLYILSINLQLKANIGRLIGIKLEARGSLNRDVLSILSNSEADSIVFYSAAVVTRLNASETIAASVYSNSQSLNLSNTTLFAVLVTKNTKYPCLLLRSKTSKYTSGEWWKGIEDWESVDTQCASPNSELSKGIFVAEVAGVYFLAATVVVKTSPLSSQTR